MVQRRVMRRMRHDTISLRKGEQDNGTFSGGQRQGQKCFIRETAGGI